MSTRTIMIFPKLENTNIINDIRSKYDPLAEVLLPHITLVFPFDSALTNEELTLYLKESLRDIHPFKFELEGFSTQQNKFGNFMMIDVVRGIDLIKNIHLIGYMPIS